MTSSVNFPRIRPRRLRMNESLRQMVSQTKLDKSQLIQPLLIHFGSKIKNPIKSMPGQFQISCDNLRDELLGLKEVGIERVILFGIPEFKDATGSSALDKQGIIQQAIQEIKTIVPEFLVIADLCFCEYTDHGHCGIMNEKNG